MKMTNTIRLPKLNSNILALTSFILICAMTFLTVKPALAQSDDIDESHPCYEVFIEAQQAVAAAKLAVAAGRFARDLRDAAESELARKLAQKALDFAIAAAERFAERAIELSEELDECLEGKWILVSGSCESGGCGNA